MARSCSRPTGPTAKPAADAASPTRWTPRPPPGPCRPAGSPPCQGRGRDRGNDPLAARARQTAVKARTQAINALKALVVTAPVELREQPRGRSAAVLVGEAAGLRPGPLVTHGGSQARAAHPGPPPSGPERRD